MEGKYIVSLLKMPLNT